MKRITLLLVFLLSITLSCGYRRLNALKNSRNPCQEQVRRNFGLLRYRKVRGCQSHSWLFQIHEGSTLVLVITSAVEDDPILVKRKSAENSDFNITNRILNEDSLELRVSPPTRYVELQVPATYREFDGSYKLLVRPPITQRTNRCFASNPNVVVNCKRQVCTFKCKEPQFIPRNKYATSIRCTNRLMTSYRSLKWQRQINHLCIPRSSLATQCFHENGDFTEDCEYSPSDFAKFFEREENLAGQESPGPVPGNTPYVLGVGSTRFRAKRRQRFRTFVCQKNPRTGYYRWRCSKLRGKRMKTCFFWRYLTPSCSGNGIFS